MILSPGWSNAVKKVGLLLLVLLGAAVLAYDAYIGLLWTWKQLPGAVGRALREAGQLTEKFTDRDFSAAEERYRFVLLRGGEDYPPACQGLAILYADWATLQTWRGLDIGAKPQSSLEYALKSYRGEPSSVETFRALAYSFAAVEEVAPKRATREWARKLLEQ